MQSHHALTDREFEQQFAATSLPPEYFTHEAHLRLAWIHIRRYGLQKAVENICRQIASFDQKHGDGTKYNVTVTIAAVRAVHHFMRRSEADTFVVFLEEFPRLRSQLKALLARHYSWDIFSDPAAQKVYQEPDLLPF